MNLGKYNFNIAKVVRILFLSMRRINIVLILMIIAISCIMDDSMALNILHVAFHNSSQEQIREIKNYYKNQYPGEIYDEFLSYEYDLNDDEKNELFVYYGGINCGTAGCTTEIFTFVGDNKIKKIFSQSTYGEIEIVNEKTNGFRDINVIGGTQHLKNINNIFKWDSTSCSYKYQHQN